MAGYQYIEGFVCPECKRRFANQPVNLADGLLPQHRNSDGKVCPSSGQNAVAAKPTREIQSA